MLERNTKIERFKMWVDYFKHLTTLSTGSIVLMATLLQKQQVSSPHFHGAITISFIGFIISVLGSVSALTGNALEVSRIERADVEDDLTGYLTNFGSIASWAGFLVGLCALFSVCHRKSLDIPFERQ